MSIKKLWKNVNDIPTDAIEEAILHSEKKTASEISAFLGYKFPTVKIREKIHEVAQTLGIHITKQLKKYDEVEFNRDKAILHAMMDFESRNLTEICTRVGVKKSSYKVRNRALYFSEKYNIPVDFWNWTVFPKISDMKKQIVLHHLELEYQLSQLKDKYSMLESEIKNNQFSYMEVI